MLALGVLWFGFGRLLAWRQVHSYSALKPPALAASSGGLDPAKILRDEIGGRAMARLHRLKRILRTGSVGQHIGLRATTSGLAIAEARRP
jgi:hypothetical protein